MELQRTAGNQAVGGLLQQTRVLPSGALLVSRLVSPSSRHSALSAGMRGAEVAELQNKLNNAIDESNLAITSVFDGPTDKVVRRFQTASDLKPDGVVGKNTWEALDGVAGGAEITADDEQRVGAIALVAKTLFAAGDFQGALDKFKEVYADPTMAHKASIRASTAFRIASCHHQLGETVEAVSFYEEAMSSPARSIALAAKASENLRRARLGLSFLADAALEADRETR